MACRVSFRDSNHGVPQNESERHWQIAKARSRVKSALLKEEAAAKLRIEEARKAKAAEHKAEQLAEREVRRLHAIEARAVRRTAVQTAETIRETREEADKRIGRRDEQAPRYVEQEQDAAATRRSESSLKAALSRAAAATQAADVALSKNLGSPIALPISKRTTVSPTLPLHARPLDVRPSEENKLQKEVRGLRPSLARSIAKDLAKLSDMSHQMKTDGHLFRQNHFDWPQVSLSP